MHLRPIYRLIQLLIQPADHRHAIAAHNIQPEGYFFRGYFFFSRPDDALYGFLENEVHAAVTGEERAYHRAPVEREDGYALLGGVSWVTRM